MNNKTWKFAIGGLLVTLLLAAGIARRFHTDVGESGEPTGGASTQVRANGKAAASSALSAHEARATGDGDTSAQSRQDREHSAHRAESPQTNVPSKASAFPASIFNSGIPKMSTEQLAPYLLANRRSAGSLLASARMTGDRELLQEAVRTFPTDPHVLFDWLQFGATTPEERRQALDAFRQAAPDNALGDYLSALDHFQNGNVKEALNAMSEASGKTRVDDYSFDSLQDREEAYVAAGYSRAQAAAAAYYETEIPYLQSLHALSKSLLDLQQQYTREGAPASAQAVGEMGIRLGSQIQSELGTSVILELVGVQTERQFLESLNPDAVLADSGQTLAKRLQELERRKSSIRGLMAYSDLPFTFDEAELNNFMQRARLHGEVAALGWLKEKYGTNAVAP